MKILLVQIMGRKKTNDKMVVNKWISCFPIQLHWMPVGSGIASVIVSQ